MCLLEAEEEDEGQGQGGFPGEVPIGVLVIFFGGGGSYGWARWGSIMVGLGSLGIVSRSTYKRADL